MQFTLRHYAPVETKKANAVAWESAASAFCVRCGKCFSEAQPLDGVRTDFGQACKVVHLLAETMGIRGICRFTGFDIQTVLNILESAGRHCAALMDTRIRNLKVQYVQADEVFSWIACKPDKVEEADPKRGAFFTFLSIAHQQKLRFSPI